MKPFPSITTHLHQHPLIEGFTLEIPPPLGGWKHLIGLDISHRYQGREYFYRTFYSEILEGDPSFKY